MKRAIERYYGDAGFRDRVATDASAVAELGIAEDPGDLLRLMEGRRARANESEGVRLFRRFGREMAAIRGPVRRAAPPERQAFRAWRTAQIARCDLQLSRADNALKFHGTLVFELSVGCSVGCWFCGAGAQKVAGHFLYTSENATLWRDTLEIARSVCGKESVREAFCYWATDPLDNPDYERFCSDFVAVLDTFPATTTALALKNADRTKRLLLQSEGLGTRSNRFSILTLSMLNRVHKEFSPDELLFVDLVLQNPEALTIKSLEGRFLEASSNDPAIHERELTKLRSYLIDPNDAAIKLPQSTACVSGFLVNMLQQTVQLISPCPADRRWPLGYYVFDQARFTTAAEFAQVLETMVERHMTTGAQRSRPARLLPDVAFKELEDGFRVTSRTEQVDFRSEALAPYLKALGAELHAGDKTPPAIAEWGKARFGVASGDTLAAIDQVWRAGALDVEPIDATPGSTRC